MDIRQLKYFIKIAEEGQITKAAEKLHMAQPPLSQSLKSLEDELGVALLERNGRKMELTEAGLVLYKKIKIFFNQLDDTITEVKETGEGLKGKLAIGCVKSCFSYIPQRIKALQEQYPHISFELREGDSYLLAELLKNRDIDIAIVRLPLDLKLFSEKSLPDENYVAVFPERWLDKSTASISLAELSKIPLLLLHRISGIGQYEIIMEQFDEIGIKPNIVCECPDVDMILDLVSEEVGATIVPESSLSKQHVRGIRKVNIKNHSINSKSSIIWLKNRYLSKSARRFIDLFPNGNQINADSKGALSTEFFLS